MVVCNFDNEDFGAVLQSVKGLSLNIPVDRVEGVSALVVPVHKLLANSWAASCLPEALCELACDSYTVDSEAGFGGWNERDDFGWL